MPCSKAFLFQFIDRFYTDVLAATHVLGVLDQLTLKLLF